MKSIIVNENLVLPKQIKVKIFKGKSVPFIVELPEFDISTEVDSRFQIEEMLNDLIYVYFGVSDEVRSTIRYILIKTKKESNGNYRGEGSVIFQKFISSEAYRLYK